MYDAVRSTCAGPKLKNRTSQSFYGHVQNQESSVPSIDVSKIKNECFSELLLNWQLWNMRLVCTVCNSVCDVALLKCQTKMWCMYFPVTLPNGLPWAEPEREENGSTNEWKIEVDIFNTFNIYWCIGLNSECGDFSAIRKTVVRML